MNNSINIQSLITIIFLLAVISIIIIIPIYYSNKPLCDGMANAKVITWIDENMNGIYDTNEKPLGQVKVGIWYPSQITNEKGQANVGEFKPGCCGNCWENEKVIVIIPEGYIATTPTEIILTGPNEVCYFGFIHK